MVQKFNSAFIVLLGVGVREALDPAVRAGGRTRASPVKMDLGLAPVALGFVCLVGRGHREQRSGDKKASMIWLILAYFFHTMGELCSARWGLSMVTKLAPPRFGSLMMGVWFLVNLFRQHARRLHRRVHREAWASTHGW